MARDLFHNAVRAALEKEHWRITNDPLTIPFGDADLQIDLGAEGLIGCELEGKKIAVEIKVFSASSFVNAFHQALGQFLNYRLALLENEPDRHLFLAVPQDVYERSFGRKLVQAALLHFSISHLVYNPEQEVIVLWKP
jgi:hypothetical protein